MTHSALDADIVRHLRRNMIGGGGEAVFFVLASSGIASAATLLPLYAHHLTASPLVVALVAAMPEVGCFLPGLFTAPYLERLPRKLPFVCTASLLSERLGFLLMGLGALWAGRRHPGVALAVFLLALICYSFGMGLISTGLQHVLAKVIPAPMRGRFFGVATFLGSAAAVPAGLAVGVVLDRYTFPTNYAICFLAAYASAMIAWAFMCTIREPAEPVEVRPAGATYLRRLSEILAHDANYRSFIAGRLLLSLGGLANGFVVVAAVSRFALPDATAGAFTAYSVAGSLVANLLLGFVGDRHGHKLALELSALIGAAAMALAWLAPSPAWFSLAFFCQGASVGGVMLATLTIVPEFCALQVRPTYIGLTGTLIGLAGLVAPVIGGSLAPLLGYGGLFVLALGLRLAGGALLRWRVRDPRFTGADSAAPP